LLRIVDDTQKKKQKWVSIGSTGKIQVSFFKVNSQSTHFSRMLFQTMPWV